MALEASGLATWQWNNNAKSAALLLAFPGLLLALVWGTFLVFGLLVGQPGGRVTPDVYELVGLAPGDPSPMAFALAAALRYAPLVLAVAAAWVVIGYFFNGALTAMATGARGLERSEAPELYNLVETLCISRGLPTPRLQIIETDALNAYASGIDRRSYAITVTRGLIEALDRDEIEAVLGHELTHIVNRDVRLLVVTAVFVGMISFLAELLWRGVYWRMFRGRRDRRQGGQMALLVAIAAVALLVGYALSVVLRLALSRRREFLADAGSVELTKNPDAMIAALRKIEGRAAMPGVSSMMMEMFIAHPPERFALSSLLATHPTIEARVQALERYAGGRDAAAPSARRPSPWRRRPPSPWGSREER